MTSKSNTPIRAKDRFLVFGAPAIEDAEIQEVVATLKSGWLGTGPKVSESEKRFAGYKGGHLAAAVNSCTAALHLSLLASGVGPGDEVITTALTFCATVNAIIHAGATPVLADVDPATMNIVTDEGGMVLARREEDIARVKVLGLHGMGKDAWKRFGDEGYKHYQVVECGFKYNMMDLQAAIGMHQLERVEPYWRRRREIWAYYNHKLAGLPVALPSEPAPDTRHAYHLYPILIDKEKAGISRDAFLDAMTAQNVGAGVHYLSIPEHPYYPERFGWKPEDFPQAQRIGRWTVILPLSAKLTSDDLLGCRSGAADHFGFS